MNIQTYLQELGDRQAAKLLNEKERTVASWRRGERFPAHRKIPGIIQKSNGKLTFSSFFKRSDDDA